MPAKKTAKKAAANAAGSSTIKPATSNTAMFTPDLSGLQACIDDVKAASLDSDSGPPEPTGFPSLMQRLETSRALLSKVFQISTADPFISSLNGIGETGYVQTLAADPTREGTAGLLLDIAQAILQKGEGYSPDATDAFLEVVADLYDGFLSAEDRSGIKMPERVIVPPMVKWGNPDFGPYTWPFDATNHFGVKNAVVSMPPSNTRSGLMAWSALGHETCGHDVLHANAGLQGEIARLVRAALAKEPPLDDKHTHLSSYWATRIDETSSDVMGILNMGPAAAIGLVAYFRGLSAGAGSPAKLRRDGAADDPHPADSLRGYLAAATLRLLSFSDREGWAKAIEAQTDHDVGAGNSVRVAGNKITQEQAKISARIVAETIAAAPTHILNHHSLLDIQDWRDSDEQIVVALRTALLSGNNPSAAFQPGVYATHVVAAATTAALAGAAAPALLFRRMIQMLKALSTRNPTWGPLAIVHRGSIARDFVRAEVTKDRILWVVCNELDAIVPFDPPIINNDGDPVSDASETEIDEALKEIDAEDTNKQPPRNCLDSFIMRLTKELGEFTLESQQLADGRFKTIGRLVSYISKNLNNQ